jgi:hypothetical protein
MRSISFLAKVAAAAVISAASSMAAAQQNDDCRYVLEEGKLLLIEDESPYVLGILPAKTATSLAWVPPGFAGLVAVLGAVLDTGSAGDDFPVRQPISP